MRPAPLSHTQDAQDIVDAVEALLDGDKSKDVRMAVVLSLPLDTDTLPVLLQRARDVSPQVTTGVLRRQSCTQSCSCVGEPCSRRGTEPTPAASCLALLMCRSKQARRHSTAQQFVMPHIGPSSTCTPTAVLHPCLCSGSSVCMYTAG